MADKPVIDMVHDLVHRAYDAVTGTVAKASAPDKPAASMAPAGDWVERAKSQAQADRNKSIDDQVAADGG